MTKFTKEKREEINKMISSYGIAKNADLVDWIESLLNQVRQETREELIRRIEKMKKLHTHNSIPTYTGEEHGDEGDCIICQRNVILEEVEDSLTQKGV